MKIRREAKRKALERLMVEVGMYDRFPEEDPFEDGAVLVFKRNIRSVYYTYAAVRAQHVWYITGNAPQGLHWAELVEFMVDCEDLMVQRDAYDAFAKWAENEEDE